MSESLKYGNIWKVTLPVMLSLLAQNIINLTDTIFLGWVGEVELGASAIGGLFYYGLFVIGFGFSIGSQILISRRNGEGNYVEIGKIFNHSMYFLLALGILIVVPVIFFANGILSHALSSEAVAAATVKYIEVRIWGIFPAFACAVFRALYIGILKPATLSWAAAIMALLNVILAYAMVFGELGFAPRGIEGAALASVISEFVAMLFLIVATLISKYQRTYGLYYFGWPKWKIIGHTLEISVFTMLQNVMAMGGWLTFFIIIEQSGERALASSNIARSIYIMMMIPLWAFATTTNSLVSNLIGEGNIHLVTKAIKRITLMSLIATALLVIPGSFLPNLILGLYTADASLIVETTPIFYIVMAALIVFSVVIPVYSGVTGTGNTRAGMIIEAITIAAYLLYVYIVVIRFRQGVVVAWLSEFVYFLFMGSLSLAYLRFGKWQKIKI